jgi:hypothetical protein
MGITTMLLPSWPVELFAGAILSLTAIHARAQAAPPKQSAEPQNPHLVVRTPEEAERRRLNLRRIVLDVQVIDASGKSATELDQSDFTVLEDGQPRNTVYFRSIHGTAATDPVQIIVVLDT